MTGEVRELVLVGGGHSHVEVLRRFGRHAPTRTRLTVVLESPVSVYSGMVPGLVAGQYTREEVEIDVAGLALRAGARVVVARLTGVDAQRQSLELEEHPPVPYDVASLNLGSAPAGLDLPGVAASAVPVRPMAAFLHRLVELKPGPRHVLVVGGGAGGVELAFALGQRLAESRVAIVEAGPRLLPNASPALARRIQRRASASGIAVHCGRRVVGADASELRFADGGRLPFEMLVWTAGTRGVPALAQSALPRDAHGFVLVGSTLQVLGRFNLFAAGDCATLDEARTVPKAGVHAVRQGPVLAVNLQALLEGRPLRRYRPQRDFLTLLNLADGTAAGGKWGVAFEGRWVLRLKDRIDRRFIARYRL